MSKPLKQGDIYLTTHSVPLMVGEIYTEGLHGQSYVYIFANGKEEKYELESILTVVNSGMWKKIDRPTKELAELLFGTF